MNTNKHTATRKTKTGKTIEVTVERGTWDEKVSLDGFETGSIKTHLVNRTTINLRDENGKVIASGSDLSMVTPTSYFKNYKELIAKGAVARVGDAFVGQETADLIAEAIAEADAAAPKTDKQIEIEQVKAEAERDYDKWYNSEEQKSYRKFVREMEREDSDY